MKHRNNQFVHTAEKYSKAEPGIEHGVFWSISNDNNSEPSRKSHIIAPPLNLYLLEPLRRMLCIGGIYTGQLIVARIKLESFL